jgi:transcriptional regulator with XRE-family HTH domain
MINEPNIGRTLRRLRQEREWSLRELAKRADMSLNGVHNIETGHSTPSSETVFKLAKALGVSPGTLYLSPKALAPPPRTYLELLERAGAVGSGLERPIERDAEDNVSELFEGASYVKAYEQYIAMVEARQAVMEIVESYRARTDLPHEELVRLENLAAAARERTMVAFGEAWSLSEEAKSLAHAREDTEEVAAIEERQRAMVSVG